MNNIWNYSLRVRAVLLAIAVLTLGTAESAVRFEENLGQTSKQVRYLARSGGKTFYFGDHQLYIELWGAAESSSVVRMSFAGLDSKARWQASGTYPEPISYFVGRDETRWVRGARQFSQLEWKGLYPGIDAVFHGNGASMEYDLVLAKGADPASVRLRFEGDGRARMAADGAIEIVTPAGSLWQRPPRIYQESANGVRIPVSGRFVAGAGTRDFTLQLGAYNRALPLVIDPVLEFSTYLGGDNDDEVKAVGDGFVAGTTRSVAFPGAPAARRRSRNIFLKAPPSSGSFSNGFYGTFVIGGSGDDDLTAAVVANLFGRPEYYLAGATRSRDFALGNHIPTSYGGGATDGFLVRVQAQGGQLYGFDAQFIGGSGEDRITALASSGGIVVGVGVTDSPDLPVINAFQPALAGGKDAFVFTLVTYSSTIQTLTYLGGSGDDAAYAVAITTAGIVVGGETQSLDFPLTGGWPSSVRSGPSDGFLALLSLYYAESALKIRLIGGSGEDRVQGIAVPSSYYDFSYSPFVAVTGTTTSPDFPLVNPVQEKFGGASDAFLLRLDLRDGTLNFSTLLGGSDTEEGTAVAMDTQGNIAVAGVTRSTDLPAFQALQPNPAGGEDGFFGWFDVNNHLQQLTYFGGSGDDHIYAVAFVGASARIVGSTTSTDLPLKNPSQDTKDGGLDGFIADIGTDYIIGPDRLSIGKDMAVYLSLSAARNNSKIALKLISSDPSKVRFTQNGQTSGEVTLAAPWNTTIEALTDSGQVDLIATADGLPPRTISVTLLPAAILVGQPTLTFTTWSPPQYINYSVVAWNPATNQVEGYGVLRDGVPPLSIAWSSSDEAVVKVGNNGNSYAEPVGPGSAQLTLTSATLPVVPPGSISVTVVRPDILPYNMTLGKDLQANLQFAITQDGKTTLSYLSPKGTITFRSSDASRLLLSLDPGKSGQESVTVDTKTSQSLPMVWAQALAGDGDVKVLISSTEILADREITVTLRPTTVTLVSGFSSGGAVTLSVGNAVPLFSQIGFLGSPPYLGYSLRPGVTLHYTWSTSDPKVVTVSPTSSDSTSTVSPVATAVGNGTAELSLTVDDPAIQVTPLSVTVQPVSVFVPAAPQLYVGKDLRTSTSLSFRLPPNSDATVTVADPSLALVSPDALTAGQAEISKQFSGDLTFWVYGLAAAGQTGIRVQVNGIVVDGTVTLAPAGFAFSTSTVTSTFYSKGSLFVSSYALDIPTGIPLYAQPLRPGVQASLLLQQDGTAISLNPTQIAFSSDTDITGVSAAYTVNELGETNVWFDAPAGFTAPSRRTRVKIRTVPSGIALDRAPIAANHATFAIGVGVRTDNGLQVPVTITATSSDPTKLLVASTTGEAASSATIPPLGRLQLVGLADTGAVTLHLTGPNLEPLDVLVPLYPLRVSIGSSFGGSLSGPLSLLAQTAGLPLYAQLDVAGSGNANLSLRPEASPLRVEFNSTDPTVVTVDPPFVEFTTARNLVSFVIKPVSPGNAEIHIQSPSGLAVNPSSITVSVRAPKFLLPKVVLGRDMQGAVAVSAEYGGAPQDNKILTLTSLSPDRLLLSRSADVQGSASISLAYQTNASQSDPIYLQALAGDGEATIRISADGYADSDSTVLLVAPALVLNVNSFTFELGNSATGTIFMQASPDAIPPGGQSLYDIKIRAGGPRITTPLAIADPSVANVDPAQITFGPGDAAQPFTLKAGSAPGTTSLTVGVPDGFADPGPARRTATIQVTLRTLNLNCNNTEIGKDAQESCNVSLPANVTATAVSSQPSSLLVSFDPNAAGSAALAAVAPQALYVQALADNGSVDVLLSAPGYRDVKVTLQLRPSAFFFLDSTDSSSIQLKAGTTRDTQIQFRRFQASGDLWYYSSTLRPGAGPVRLDVSSTNPAVVGIPADAVIFAPGDGFKSIRLTAVAPGSATVRVPAPSGFAAAPRDQADYIVQP